MHWNNKTDPNTYSKSYDALDSIKEADDQEYIGDSKNKNKKQTKIKLIFSIKGSSKTSEQENSTQTNYTYNTSIEVNSPKQYLIKRVHTNKESGILVNEKKYDYGKTVNSYDYDDVYKNDENTETSKNKRKHFKKEGKSSSSDSENESSNSESEFNFNPSKKFFRMTTKIY